jgi:hypothetical protein
MNTKYVAVFAVLAVTLVAATALTNTDNAFATKSKSQAVSQANECGNDTLQEYTVKICITNTRRR